MEKKAEAYAKYNKAAVAEMMIKVLPDVAAKIEIGRASCRERV